MEYRKIPGTEEEISVIGLGAYFDYGDAKQLPCILEYALQSGVNLIDTVAYKREAFEVYGQVLRRYDRKSYKLQIHFGSDYSDGKYGWTDRIDIIKKNVDMQLSTIGCGYADIAMIHCIDDIDVFNKIMEDGLWEYLLELKRTDTIHYIGCSTHNPLILRMFVDTGEINVGMFSINMVYDYLNIGNYAKGTFEDRYKIYEYCRDKGVGVVAMKPFAGKRLLHKGLNSLNRSFSPEQCIQYVLDRPAVLSAICGVGNVDELKADLHYLEADAKEKDYSEVYSVLDDLGVMLNSCVYCNHCMPCPVGLDIGLINKYYDLALVGDNLAENHYLKLDKHAGDCISCKKCDGTCPFKVKQTDNMKKIFGYFGI